ncbi:hypothetical protein LTR56_006331 [Elasticomyces elasticus]|nr:hypothetical protein LTR56_006331 [Elasticomyces elasticus]KAK3663379.1 hypothetical protein LTR22_005786 [Elasticomyces elasticus]KAK4925458.1 hypothetical protein LTR49_007522 [Elasticomyces elasticus]KAK5764553.1 hypothetical protein LTS12_005283 [Elasticomyces elasticus]
MAPPTRPRGSYMVGIICALDVEKAAIDALLDEEHGGVAPVKNDNNNYSFGRIGQHDVVIACLPAGVMGKASAATVANDMMRSFPIKVGFMVGIGGGVPNDTKDVRLGDVVVSEPTGMHGGVVQWDFGKREKEGFQRKYTLNKPPLPLLSAVSALKSNRRRLGSGVHLHFQEMISKFPPMQEEYSSPGQEHDILFEAGYPHESGNTCVDCNRSRRIQRPQRKDDEPRTHYGNIASGDQVVKDGPFRDHIAQQEGIICFEMEAAGLMDNFPCVVIRGICDYADSHKNKRWQPYAAFTAACYCKELLGVVQPQGIADLDLASSEKYRIPFDLRGIPATQHFVQRDVPMKQLEAFFLPASQPASEPTSQPAGRKVFVVHGLGGIGKTQLCVAFARKYQEDFSAVLWLDGSSEDAVRQSLANAYQRLPATFKTPTVDIQGSIDGLLQWLSLPDNTGWLLIFDNVDRDLQSVPKDPQAFNYRSFLPSADHGSIIVTTRLSRMQIPKASLQLLRLDDRCAKEMLEDWVGKKLLGKATGSDDVDKLLEKLGGLPLALVQAGAYLRQTNMSIEKYLEYYDRTWTTLMELQDRYLLQEYQERSVLTTWKMSYERVGAVNPQAVAILDQWAFLHPGDIWYELATSWPQSLEKDGTSESGTSEDGTSVDDTSDDGTSVDDTSIDGTSDDGSTDDGSSDDGSSVDVMIIATDELKFRDSLAVLCDYSLVVADDEGTGFSIHPVVHAWCLHNATRAERREQLCDRALLLVAAMIPNYYGDRHWIVTRRLAPHAKAVAARHLESVEREGVRGCLRNIADFLNLWDGSAEVEALYLRALRGSIKALGQEHEATLITYHKLGLLYQREHKLKEAEEMYLRALRGYDLPSLRGDVEAWGAKYTPTHTTVDTVSNLGQLYTAQDKLEEAEDMYLLALGISSRLLSQSLSTPSRLSSLSLSYRSICHLLGASSKVTNLWAMQGRLKGRELQLLLRRMDEIQKRYGTYGPNDPLTISAIDSFCTRYAKQGRHKEVEKICLWVLETYEEAWGPMHRFTLNTVKTLGSSYHRQGELVKARRTYTLAVDGYREAAGEHEADLRFLREQLAYLREDECKSTTGCSGLRI